MVAAARLAALLLLALSGCVFEAEPDKACYYEATIGCGPGCPPRTEMRMIVCPGQPFQPQSAADGGS